MTTGFNFSKPQMIAIGAACVAGLSRTLEELDVRLGFGPVVYGKARGLALYAMDNIWHDVFSHVSRDKWRKPDDSAFGMMFGPRYAWYRACGWTVGSDLGRSAEADACPLNRNGPMPAAPMQRRYGEANYAGNNDTARVYAGKSDGRAVLNAANVYGDRASDPKPAAPMPDCTLIGVQTFKA